MRYGPLSQFDITRLTDILDANRVSYDVEASQDDVDAIDEARRERAQPRARPSFEGVMEYLYLDVPDSAVALIAKEIEKMGYGFVPTGDELQDDPEFDALVARREVRSTQTLSFFRQMLLLAAAIAVAACLYFGFNPIAYFASAS